VTTLLLGLALLVVGGLGIALLELLIRRADVAAALVFVSVLLQAVFVDRVPALVLPGGVQVYVTDVVSGLLLGAAMLRLLRRGEDTELSWRAQLAGYRLGFAPDAVVHYRYRTGIWQTARQAYKIGVNCERILRDFVFLRDGDGHGDGGGSASGRALGRAAWLATRLPYLAGSRRHRGQWVSVAAEYLGRLRGAARYRLLDRRNVSFSGKLSGGRG
jgi:hypothetical protein